MKKAGSFGIILLILVGCRGIQNTDDSGVSKLTPFVTQADINVITETPESVTETVSTPAPTAAPTIHVVALGETISSIALLYGVPMDAITKANPGVKPTVLIVGDELVIPISNSRQSVVVDPLLLENIHISDPDCVRMRDGGLWCAVLVNNHGQEDLENVVVTFSFRDSDGNVIEERSAPTLMRFAASGAVIPAVMFLEHIPLMYADTHVVLFSALAMEASTSTYLTVEVEEETHTLSEMEGVISGWIRVEAEQDRDRADIWIGAAAFDVDGAIVGVRRLESSVTTNEMFNFNITIYSSTGNIDRVVLYTEAF